MIELSSTEKGNSLEFRVHKVVEKMVKNDDFFVNGKFSETFMKKAYYSKDRGGNVILDVTIETTFPSADTYSFLTVLECKNTGKKISVDDIEEFASKLRGIGDHNTKGVMVSTAGFQSGTIRYAEINKIGLIRMDGSDSLEWVKYRIIKQNTTTEILEADHSPSFIAYFNERFYKNLPDLLLEYGVIDNYHYEITNISIPYKSDNDIENIIRQLGLNYVYRDGALDQELLCSRISELYDADFYFGPCTNRKDVDHRLLGKITLDPLLISVYEGVQNEYKSRFTLAHEIGHLVLHSQFLRPIIKGDCEIEDFEYSPTNVTNKNMEIQADLFAANLLLPKHLLEPFVFKFFAVENIFKGYLFLDNQHCNQVLVFTLLEQIHEKFRVSKEVAKIRLKSLGFLKENYENKIGDHLRNYRK